MIFSSVNPATGAVVHEWAGHTPSEVLSIIHQASRAQGAWRHTSLDERATVLRRLAQVLDEQAADIAPVIVEEMGKPIVQALTEVRKCATACTYYADAAHRMLDADVVDAGYRHSRVQYDPMGLVLSIMPWNFPLWQFFRFAAPALLAGNGILLKHAPTTWGSAFAALRACHTAGVPQDLVAALLIDIPAVEGVIAHEAVRAVTFTGSTTGGAAVAAVAGRHVRKTVMELGGSDAAIVRADADLDLAVRQCVEGRTMNAGQSCIATKRWILDETIADRFLDMAHAAMQSHTVGLPMDPATTVGPLARRDLRDTVLDQVDRSVAAGATLLGDPRADVDPRGFYVRPAILVMDGVDDAVTREEVFGPVACVVRSASDTDAVRLANDTPYGLGASIFTADMAVADRMASELECGSVFVNAFVRSDARLPFGGVKQSGYGRELGPHGLREFVNVRTVVIA